MKNYIIITITILFIYSCKENNNLNNATVKIEKFENKYGSDHNAMKIQISVNKNIDDILEYEHAASCYIYCPLSVTDFNKIGKNGPYIKGFNLGDFKSPDTIISNRYFYTFDLKFYENNSKDYISKEKLLILLKDNKCVNCKIYIWKMISPYHDASPIFCIPSDSILNEIK